METKIIFTLLPVVLFVIGCSDSTNEPSGNPDVSVNATELDQLEQKCNEKDEELGVVRPDGWQDISHCQYASGDISKVFPQDRVSKLSITMTAEDYAAMQVNLDEVLGADFAGDFTDTGTGPTNEDTSFLDECQDLSIGDSCTIFGETGMCTDISNSIENVDDSTAADVGTSGDAGTTGDVATNGDNEVILACFPEFEYDDYFFPGGDLQAQTIDPCGGLAPGNACTQGEHQGMCAQTTGPMICQVDAYDNAYGLEFTPVDAAAKFYDSKPSYFKADIEFNGIPYTSVGIRYKGNSSLAFSMNEKKPLRLKLDEWEDDIPEIKNQRMFGFQDLSLAPNGTDPSYLNQVLAAATFREHGVPAPQSSFVEVTLDSGDGPKLLGLYAMTEVPEGPLLDRFFSNDEGNLYKPDGQGAHFVSFVEESFHLKSKEDTDFGDVKKFIDALNASRADRLAWRSELESSFDMKGFIDFLAVNQIIANWDTYGALAHNFYLYTDEQDEQISFIPWDFDLSFYQSGTSDFTLRTFGGHWPLLQAIARDVEYASLYQERLAAIAQAEFTSGNMKQRIDNFAALIEDAVAREKSLGRETDEFSNISFADAIEEIKQHVDSQQSNLNEFLDTQVQSTGF